MKHITGSLAVLAVALSFTYADSGDARIMKALHQETGTGVVAVCKSLHTTTRESIRSLESSIKTNRQDFRKIHAEKLGSFLDLKNKATKKALVDARKKARDDEKKIRMEFADQYSETKDSKLKDLYATKLIAVEQAFYDSVVSLVKTDKKDAYTVFVRDAMAVVTKNKAMRLEIVMKRIDMMMQCGQGRHDKALQLIDKVLASEISVAKKQQFLEKTSKRMHDMKKKLQKSDEKRNGSAFEGVKDDRQEMIDEVLESVERAMSELEDHKVSE